MSYSASAHKFDGQYQQGLEDAKRIVKHFIRREVLVPMVIRRLRETTQQLDDSFDSVVLYCQQRIADLTVSLDQNTLGSSDCVQEEIAACTERLERLKICTSVSPVELKRRYDFMVDAAEALFMRYNYDVDKSCQQDLECKKPQLGMILHHIEFMPRFEGVPRCKACDYRIETHGNADKYALLFQTDKVSAYRLEKRREFEKDQQQRLAAAHKQGLMEFAKSPPGFFTCLHVPVPNYIFSGVGVRGINLPSLYDQDDATRKLNDQLREKIFDTLNDMANLVVEQLQNFCLKNEFGMTDAEAHVLFNIMPNTVRWDEVYGSDGELIDGRLTWKTEFRLVTMWGEPSEQLQKIVQDYIRAGRPMLGKVFAEV